MNPFRRFFLAVILAVPAFVCAQHVKFTDAKPEAGGVIRFTYESSGTGLEAEEDIDCYAYVFHRTKQKVLEVKLAKEGKVFVGAVPTTDSTSLVALQFSVEGKIDENPKGYYTPVFKGGKQTAYSYLSEAILLDVYGINLRMKSDQARAVLLYREAFDLMPELKKGQHQYRYFVCSYHTEPLKGGKLVKDQIAGLSRLSEENAMTDIFDLYMLIKEPAKADSVKKIILTKFPTGKYAWSLDYASFFAERTPQVMEDKLKLMKEKYGYGNGTSDSKKMSPFYERLASAYGEAKNYEKFDLYSERIVNKGTRAGFYNSVAWPLAERNENSAYAAKISKLSLDLLDAAKDDEYPAYFDSKSSYLNSLLRGYATFADTYALILHNLGKDAEAVVYQEKAVEYCDADGNARYVMYLDLSGNKEKAFMEAERFLKEGKGTDAMRERLKSLYAAKSLSMPFKIYITKLEQSAKEKERAVWAKKMINIPAPDFSLRNLNGETVTLAGLKGKIVILDYWATWCGPCVASFPGMQKAVTKYAGDPDVAFLFINTRQTESNREELVKKFIADHKYKFNVLYDTRSKQDPNKFDLIGTYDVSGIPTKIIIDADGNIRFKVVGFSGSADGVVAEIDTMIELIKSSDKSAR